MIAVYCAAKGCSQADAKRMIAACNTQVVRDFAPAWGLIAQPIEYFADAKSIPVGAPTIAIVDTCDDPDALAYHTESTTGIISGVVGVQTILDDSGTLMSGSVSVSGALSHEILETVKDPFCDAWCSGPMGKDLWAFEVCDPVQDTYYEIDGIAVSGFVLPRWFDDDSPPGAKVDWMEVLRKPFALSAGGYAVTMRAGATSQVGAARPDWRPGAPVRTLARLAGGA